LLEPLALVQRLMILDGVLEDRSCW
jgi:hypothetical protein